MKRLFILILIIIAISAIFYLSQNPFSLEMLQQHKNDIALFYNNNPVTFSLGFIFIYIISTALALPIATLLSLTAGFVFGSIIGTFYVVLSATIGSTIIFLLTKMAVGEFLKKKASTLYNKIKVPFTENPVSYLLFMRLVPLFPFTLVNIVPALFNIKLTTYIWVTFIGIIPGSFIYVNVGTSLAEISTLSDIFSTQLIIAFTLLGCFSLVPIIIRKYKRTKSTEE
jgi:uncharacterized membrane protein YdjX (TVP38/TMEM64 family)